MEMQENNQQLLQDVRHLNTKKVEELNAIQNHINMQSYEGNIFSYEKQLKYAEQSQRANEEMLAMCLQQNKRFKELYFDAFKNICKEPAAESIDGIEGDVTVMSSTIISQNVPKDGQDGQALAIEKTLQDKIKELKDLRELISANCQLSTQAEFANQQLKIKETDISIQKKQIQTLEERNQLHDKTMKDEALKKLTTIENRCEYLEGECRRLKETNCNLEIEQMELRRQQLKHSISQLLTAAKSPTPNIVVSTIPCEDLMRKVETLNAMTIRLRDERDTLLIDVKNLTARIPKLEEEFVPLQEKSRLLLAQAEKRRQVIIMLGTNVNYWEKRASDLVKQNNKNLEDIKQLQSERENLAKMLTTEKENLRQVSEKLNTLKSEKIRLGQEVTASNKELLTTLDERKKIQDQLNTLKETNIRLTHEIIAVKRGEVKETQLSKKAAEDQLRVKMEKFDVWKDEILNDLRESRLNETNLKSQVEELQTQIRQHLAAASVFPRFEVTPSQQVLDEVPSTSGSNSSLLAVISSHHQVSPSNTVATQVGGHKRSRNVDGDSSKGVQVRESSVSEKMSPQNKRTRLGAQTFRGFSESALDMKYEMPTASPRCQEDILIVEDSEDEDDDGIDKTTAVMSAHGSHTQQIVIADLVDEIPIENKQEKPMAGSNGQAEGLVKNERSKKNDENVTIRREEDDDVDDGNGGVSSEGQMTSGNRVEEGREVEASIQMSADNAQLRSTRSRRSVRGRSVENQQRPTPIVWDEEDRDQQVSPQNQQLTSPHRGGPIRGQLVRGGSRGRPRRPYRS